MQAVFTTWVFCELWLYLALAAAPLTECISGTGKQAEMNVQALMIYNKAEQLNR